jgi:hypothetical protein
MATKPRSDSERLQWAKAEVPKVEARIDAAAEFRRQTLRREHANGLTAIRADRELTALKLYRLRLIDQIELLSRAGPPVVQDQKQQGWAWPSDLPSAQAALAEIQPTLMRLRSIPRNDRHAGHDRDQDFFTQREYQLLRLIESFQPRKMTPDGVIWPERPR